ncbi:unnamed protein product [Effrenium voratum]|uniref:Uncharacterized protein n=1 Tax=Effrenium voratum TaxID=2562239 RepID=A0AA36HJV8_9DINO|nr:unnamed protein product [Effrenium voratum]CAJ1416640.1 unnamed protein product [Effrenium voratum]
MQSIATFAAGVFTGQSLSSCHASLPQCTLHEESYRLQLHLVGAQLALADDFWSRQRPQLIATLGTCEKRTEPAVFDPGSDCNWRFGDKLTFALRLRDLGCGLRLRLQGKRDFRLGPWQVELAQSADLGEGLLDLQKALQQCRKSAESEWESPLLHIPLLNLQGSEEFAVFALVVLEGDLPTLLEQAEMAGKSVVQRAMYPCVQCTSCACEVAEPESEAPPASEYSTCEVPPTYAKVHAAVPTAVPRLPEDFSFAEPAYASRASRGASRGESEDEKLFTAGLRGRAGTSTSLPLPTLRLPKPTPKADSNCTTGVRFSWPAELNITQTDPAFLPRPFWVSFSFPSQPAKGYWLCKVGSVWPSKRPSDSNKVELVPFAN